MARAALIASLAPVGAVMFSALDPDEPAEKGPRLVPIRMCDHRDRILTWLKHSLGEVPVASGMIDPSRIMVITAPPSGSSFTVLTITAGGIACFTGQGTGLEFAEAGRGT